MLADAMDTCTLLAKKVSQQLTASLYSLEYDVLTVKQLVGFCIGFSFSHFTLLRINKRCHASVTPFFPYPLHLMLVSLTVCPVSTFQYSRQLHGSTKGLNLPRSRGSCVPQNDKNVPVPRPVLWYLIIHVLSQSKTGN